MAEMRHEAGGFDADELDRAALFRTTNVAESWYASRLETAYARMSPAKKLVVDALPVLLHINHPLLPGYSGPQTPAGIDGYFPSGRGRAVLRQFASIQADRLRRPATPIAGVYLMGSSGSVAHTRFSDLDVWVILPRAAHNALKPKLDRIVAWAQGRGVEMQCFAVDADDFRDPASTATRNSPLLLDEFYRTAIRIAGRLPLWWLVPDSADYAGFAARILQHRFIDPGRFFDLGPVARFRERDLVHAALGELEKSLETPHKSLLKLALLEGYQRGAAPLSSECKRRLLAGQSGAETDSYLLIADLLDERFGGMRRALLRRSWLIKTSRANGRLHHADAWREKVLSWGYSDTSIEALRWPEHWSLNELFDEQQRVLEQYGNALFFMAQLVSHVERPAERRAALARLKATTSILRPAFQNGRGDLIPALVPASYVGNACIEPLAEGGWNLTQDDARVYSTQRLMGIFTWLVRNNLTLRTLAPTLVAQSVTRQRFFAAQTKQPVAVINAELTDLLEIEADGKRLITRHDDPLNYGADGAVLIREIDLLYDGTITLYEDVGEACLALAELALNGAVPSFAAIGDLRRYRLQQRLTDLLDHALESLRAGRAFAFIVANSVCVIRDEGSSSIPKLVLRRFPRASQRWQDATVDVEPLSTTI